MPTTNWPASLIAAPTPASLVPGWTFWLLPIIGFAIFTNIVNRVRNGVRAARCVATHSHSTHSDTAQT